MTEPQQKIQSAEMPGDGVAFRCRLVRLKWGEPTRCEWYGRLLDWCFRVVCRPRMPEVVVEVVSVFCGQEIDRRTCSLGIGQEAGCNVHFSEARSREFSRN